MQLDLFARVREIYADAGRALTNAEVYSALVDRGVIDQSSLDTKKPIGRAKAAHSPLKRKIRWIQQTLNTCPRIPLPSLTTAQKSKRVSATAGGGQAGGLDLRFASDLRACSSFPWAST